MLRINVSYHSVLKICGPELRQKIFVVWYFCLLDVMNSSNADLFALDETWLGSMSNDSIYLDLSPRIHLFPHF